MRWHAPQKASASYSCSGNSGNMSGKEDLEINECQLSTIQVATHGETTLNGDSQACARGGAVKVEKRRNWGWLLSGFICLNVLLLGIVFVSGSVFNGAQISTSHLQIFLILIVLLTTIWMVYYKAHTARVYRAVLYKDSHAGPVWLRAGLVLFGICSVIMDIFKIVYYVGYAQCESPVKIAFPVVQAVFVIVQTYFLWVHAKDCVQLQQSITRCGLMLTLSTNLVVWMTAVTEESLHQTIIPSNGSSNTPHSFNLTEKAADMSDCECSHNVCDVFEKAYYYLYPFNIEYSLFASAMTYVMLKNIGRQMDEHHNHHLKFSIWDVLVGPVAGLIILVVGLATFVVYEVDVSKGDPIKKMEALTIYYSNNIVTVLLMSIATLSGCIIFQLDKREHVSEKNPTRSLDVGLLVGASLGQFLINYFTIVAVLASGVKGRVNKLSLVSSLMTVIQLCLQNAFLIKGLHRKPFKETHTATVFANVRVVQRDPERRASSIVPAHTLPIPLTLFQSRLSWKRRILKEICAFLLLCNVILWIIPAFGARPQFDNTVGSDIYQFQTWVTVVNIGMPFGIFYRMHSVASLFEVCFAS
ncbi:proton channel OTOP2 [Paramisgurnus dabryanus]|uniref:proton channel OTOP2 n=1 Tax=Paramisgurnus dabryanus TaxID=90735 RepID=UPI0031F45C06